MISTILVFHAVVPLTTAQRIYDHVSGTPLLLPTGFPNSSRSSICYFEAISPVSQTNLKLKAKDALEFLVFLPLLSSAMIVSTRFTRCWDLTPGLRD